MDKWYGDEPLCKSLPSLFSISLAPLQSSLFILFWSPEILLCSLMVVFGGQVCFIRWLSLLGKLLGVKS